MGRAAPPRWPDLLLLLLLALGAAAAPASAQPPAPSQGLVVRDGTLGSGRGEIVPPGTDPLGKPATYLITPELGEQHGGNLFHSFARFGIGKGETATFTGPEQGTPIEHVISRVTGGTRSQIDGTLRSTIPDADVWLLNPNGVVFGEEAQLDVRGSFHAGTGDHVELADGERFSANPAHQGLLSTAPPAAFGFLPGGPGASATLAVRRGALSVEPGKELELAGGNVRLTQASLATAGGHVDLAAQDDVTMRHSRVDVGGETPGSVSIRGGQIEVDRGSQVLAENESAVPSANPDEPGPASISLVASGSVLVDDSVLSVNTFGPGNAGTIRLTGPGEGNPIPIVTIQNGPAATSEAPAITPVGLRAETTGRGAGGEIQIDAGSLTIQHGAGVSAGAVGSELPPFPARGAAGTIAIRAEDMLVTDRSGIAAAGWGSTGPAGTIRIDLGEDGSLRVDGTHPDAPVSLWPTWIIAANGGTPGRIEIQGGSGSSVEVSHGGQITVDSGIGDAGTIAIDTDSVHVKTLGAISANTYGAGNAGTIAIHADSVYLSGILERGGAPTGIMASSSGSGNAGTIEIKAGTLDVDNGASIDAGSFFGGESGTIDVQAEGSIEILDGAFNFFSYFLDGTAYPNTGIVSTSWFGRGGGSITLDAPEITVSRAAVQTTTVGGGGGSNILVGGKRAKRIFIGGGLVDTSSLLTPAAAGNVRIQASESITVTDRVVGDRNGWNVAGQVSSGTLSEGPAGSVMLQAPLILVDGGLVGSGAVPLKPDLLGSQEGGRGGAIELNALFDGGQVIIRRGGRVRANTLGPGDGGSITIRARDSIRVQGTDSQVTARTGAGGDGGNIALSASRIEISGGAEVSAKSAGNFDLSKDRGFEGTRDFLRDPPETATGEAGSIVLGTDEVPVEELRLDQGTIAISTESSEGGKIEIHATRLLDLDHGSEITASTGSGTGGEITIDPDLVLLKHGSRIAAGAGQGRGGLIQISADLLFGFPGTEITVRAGNPELSGRVEIHSPDVNLAGTLAELPTNLLDAASQMKTRCAARKSGERVGSFSVRGPGGLPAEPDGWLPAPLLPDAATTAAATAGGPTLVASLAGPLRLNRGCP